MAFEELCRGVRRLEVRTSFTDLALTDVIYRSQDRMGNIKPSEANDDSPPGDEAMLSEILELVRATRQEQQTRQQAEARGPLPGSRTLSSLSDIDYPFLYY
jgi:hypothetical protein